jgi:probable F420-dependent oxidoreductase
VKRTFRFGLLVSSAESARDWSAIARKASDLGFSTLFVADHFGRQLAPLPALVAAAIAAPGLRVGTFVLDNDFRHPALVAKEAATVDLLTDGRLELGIGAGWNPADYSRTGLTFEAAGVRVSKLEEALQIIKAFFAGPGPVSYEGRYYQVRELEAEPRPVQRPRPPILIGAAGRRMLQLAAREADILNFPDRPSAGVSMAGNPALGLTFEEQIAVVREAAGERYAGLELSVLAVPRVTARVDDTIDGLAQRMRTTPELVRAMPGALIGSIDGIVEKLQANRERFDLSYPVVHYADLEQMTQVVNRLAGT